MRRAYAPLGITFGLLAGAVACGALEGLGDPPIVVSLDASAQPDAIGDAPSASVTLSASPGPIELAPGGSATVAISAETQGIAGPVTVVASGLPAGVTADALVVTPDATTGTLRLHAVATADPFHGAITLVGTLGEVTSPRIRVGLDVAGPSGALDMSFGTRGIVTIRVGSDLTAFGPGWEFQTPRLASLAVQPDGKILYAGHGYKYSPTINDTWPMILGRLDAKGAPDTSFNPSGLVPGMIVEVPVGDSNFVPSGQGSVQVLPSGNIAVGGYLSVPGDPPTMFVAQFTATGELATGFGGTGLVPLVGSHLADYPGGLLVQPDGKLVLAGELGASGATLVRLLANGTPDSTFAPAPPGSPNIGFDTFTAYPNTNSSAVVWLPNGDILTALVNDGTGTTVPLAVAVSSSDGAIDKSFGAAGTLEAPSFVGPARGLAVTRDGGALLVGSGASSIELAHFVHGALDPHFGDGGVASPPIPGGKASAGSVAIGLHGEIVVGATLPGAASIGVVRYADTGALDTSFAHAGFVGFAPLASSIPAGTSQVAIDAYGRILVGTLIAASGASNGGDPVIMIARYWP